MRGEFQLAESGWTPGSVSEIAEKESLGNCGLDDRGGIWFKD